jgi:hypothetical protein
MGGQAVSGDSGTTTVGSGSSFERRYPSAEIRHMEYARLITEAAERHGLSETEYVRNLFEWDWEPPKSKAGNGDI